MKPIHFLILVIATCLTAVSCSKEDEGIQIPEKTTGNVSFNIPGADSGTSGSSVVVTPGKALDMVISQKSSYTDPDGTIYTCQPEASIKLSTTLDKVYAKDIQSLTSVSGSVDVKSSQSGTNPITKSTMQTFAIGDQQIVFDLEYEIYKYVNSKSTQIEMPYIKVNQAKSGKSSATEKEGMRSATVPSVVLRSLALSRVSAVTDSTVFEVTAKFNLELETVNTEQKQTKTLDFDVTYLGVVEEVSELYGSVVYSIENENGQTGSPFTVEGGKELTINIAQTSTYAHADNAVYTASPKASIKLKPANATCLTEELQALSTLIQTEDPTVTQSGENPVVNVYKGSFATAGQVFDFETSYEVYKTENGDEMPYLKLGEPKFVGFEVQERAKSRVIVNDTTYYDVKAKFEIEVEGVNTAEKLNETMSFEVDYTGGVVTSKDVPLELIKTEYRKDMIFYEGHDNLNMGAQAVVYRDNYYSDGSIQVDTLRENVAMQLLSYGISENPKGTKVVDDGDGYSGTYQITDGKTMRYKRHEAYKNTHTEFVFKYVSSVEVPDFDNLRSIRSGGLDWEDGLWGQVGPTDDLSQYDIFGVDTYYDASNPQDGVYYCSVDNAFHNKLRYRYNNKNYDLVSSRFAVGWYDRIASIDGELITFEEFRPTLKDVKDFDSYEEVEATSTRGPARVYTAEVTGTYLGRDVHLMSVDTVYVAQ